MNTLSMSKLQRTLKRDLISSLITANLKAELQRIEAEEAKRQLTKLRQYLEGQDAEPTQPATPQRHVAPKTAPKRDWLKVFDFVKRDRNPHGEYINAKLKKGSPVITVDFIRGNLLPYARKISKPKRDQHGAYWINIYY